MFFFSNKFIKQSVSVCFVSVIWRKTARYIIICYSIDKRLLFPLLLQPITVVSQRADQFVYLWLLRYHVVAEMILYFSWKLLSFLLQFLAFSVNFLKVGLYFAERSFYCGSLIICSHIWSHICSSNWILWYSPWVRISSSCSIRIYCRGSSYCGSLGRTTPVLGILLLKVFAVE